MDKAATITEQAMRNLPQVPRAGWLLALFVSLASAAFELFSWSSGTEFSSAWAPPLFLLTAAWFAAVYVSTIGILHRVANWAGYVRFALTSFSILIPIGLATVILFSAQNLLSVNDCLLVLAVGLVVTFVFGSLLAAWPIAQSLSTGFVSPTQTLKATRGHRRSLLFVGLALGSINRADIIPTMSKAGSLSEAVLIAAADTAVGLFSTGLAAAVAAAAWQFGNRTDEKLGFQ